MDWPVSRTVLTAIPKKPSSSMMRFPSWIALQHVAKERHRRRGNGRAAGQ